MRVEIKPFETLSARVLEQAGVRAEAIAASLGARVEQVSVV
jgi:hypothetical protein